MSAGQETSEKEEVGLDLDLDLICESSPAEYELLVAHLDNPGDTDSESDVELMAYQHSYEAMHRDEMDPLIKSPSVSSLTAPRDRCYGVFFIFGFLGLASLLPWNFFITAKKYFDYKFRNTSLPSNVSFDDQKHVTHLQKEFESYLSIVSNGSNLVFMIMTVLLVRSISVKSRVVVSTLLITVIFIVTTALVKVNTDTWQESFFICTLVLAVFMSGCQSILTGSVLGLSAIFPPIYSQSAMIGQAAGGTFSAIVSVLTHATGGDNAVTSALIYFLVATVVTLMSVITYGTLHYISFSRFHMLNKVSKTMSTINGEVTVTPSYTSRREFFCSIFMKTWKYCVSVCLVFTVTLSVFPAVCSLIKSASSAHNTWTETYFTPVICFLLFNVGDFVGRLVTFIVKYPGSHRPGYTLFMSILRIAFIPLLMLCNVQPREHLPVLLNDDAFPISLITVLGLTNGYLGTLCMSFGPLGIPEEQLEGAGIMLALAMTLGLALGSVLSILFVNIV